MKELKTTTDMVKSILIVEPKTRNCDNFLYIKFLEELGKVRGVDYLHTEALWLFNNMAALNIPTIETVSRCRRKIQQENPMLKASAAVTGFRSDRAEMFRDYARH